MLRRRRSPYDRGGRDGRGGGYWPTAGDAEPIGRLRITRRLHEAVQIGDAEITVWRIGPDEVELRIKAPVGRKIVQVDRPR